jgi:hypothetical protein
MTGTLAPERLAPAPREPRTYHTWLDHVRATTAKAHLTPEQHADHKTRAFFQQHWRPGVPAKMALPRWPARELGLRGTVDLLGADTKVQVQTDRCEDPDYELNCAGHVETLSMGEFADRGAVTPLHHDMTHNLLCEVWGRGRLVRTFPPEDRDRLDPLFTGFSRMKWTGDETPGLHPGDFWLHPGEALFIPAGWWHCVRSIGVGMMISYTSFLWPNFWGKDY